MFEGYIGTVEATTNDNVFNQLHYECEGPVCSWQIERAYEAVQEELDFYQTNQFDFATGELLAEVVLLRARLAYMETLSYTLTPEFRAFSYDLIEWGSIDEMISVRDGLLTLPQEEDVIRYIELLNRNIHHRINCLYVESIHPELFDYEISFANIEEARNIVRLADTVLTEYGVSTPALWQAEDAIDELNERLNIPVEWEDYADCLA